MERRNFFKTLAAVVVPEVIRGSLTKPEPTIVINGTENYDGKYLAGDADTYRLPPPMLFTITKVEGFSVHSMTVWLKPKKSTGFLNSYFFINDTVLVYDYDHDRSSMFVVTGPIDLVVSPLAGEEIRLTLIPVSQDQYPISIRPGNTVIRTYNLNFIKHKT